MKKLQMTSRTRYPAGGLVILLLATVLAAPGLAVTAAPAPALPATVGCTGTLTPALTEGPYYKAGSPERTTLLTAGMNGTPVTITGTVYGTNCQPVAHAWLDFWQANAAGAYDNSGYTLRGHQYTDGAGRYTLVTVVPGEYPGRTIHIHVKVQAPNGPVVTTQLFFPGVARNASDGIFNPALVLAVQDTPTGKTATLNFVLNVTPAAPPAATAPPAVPAASTSYTFPQTGFTVSGAFWTAWLGGRTFADSLYINGLPITGMRNEVSPTDGKVYQTQWFERARLDYHPENAAPNNVLLGLLGTVAARTPPSLTAFQPISNPGGTAVWFAPTGHTLGDSTTGGGALAAAWTRLGGLAQFGYPISQPFAEVSKDDGKTYLVQYFQRQRFEYHPENQGTPYVVLLGRLGAEQVKTAP